MLGVSACVGRSGLEFHQDFMFVASDCRLARSRLHRFPRLGLAHRRTAAFVKLSCAFGWNCVDAASGGIVQLANKSGAVLPSADTPYHLTCRLV